MPTLKQCALELLARKKRLEEAETKGWYWAVDDARRTVAEFDHAFGVMLERSLDQVVALAGDVEMGPVPIGIGLHYSDQEPHGIIEPTGQ